MRAMNGRIEGMTLLAGIECDIRPDGTLDLADDCLAQLDLVVASVLSGNRNFEARVARHLRQDQTLRWHIDYLLAAPGVNVAQVIRSTVDECALNQATPGASPAPGFGASDCRNGCGSHLKYLGR